MNNKLVSSSLIAMCLAAITSAAKATVFFAEDFDDITIATDPLALTVSTAGNSFKTNVTPTTDGAITARIDGTGAIFGTAGNQYLEFIDGSSVAAIRGSTGTISGIPFKVTLDFYDPSSPTTRLGATVDAGNRFTLGGSGGTVSPTNTRSVDFAFRNGAIQFINSSGSAIIAGTYTEDTPHALTLVINYSAAPFNYYLGGVQTVAAGRFDIFIDGVLLSNGDDAEFRNAVTSTTHLGLLGNGNVSISESYFDNFAVQTIDPYVPGDFNSDGKVDGADFVIWQTNFPKDSDGTLATGDANGDGKVDGADFVVWQTNFPFPPNPGVTTVPEPPNFVLLLLGLVFGVCRWQRRWIPLVRRSN